MSAGSYFERVLARWIGQRPCNYCERPLGNSPRYHHKRKHYHPDCWRQFNGEPVWAAQKEGR